jgi:hypothetical protein
MIRVSTQSMNFAASLPTVLVGGLSVDGVGLVLSGFAGRVDPMGALAGVSMMPATIGQTGLRRKRVARFFPA